MATEGQTLEQQLEELLDHERFSPPEGFREQAGVPDDAISEQAEEYETFGAERAEALHWDTKWDQVLDWSNPPFAKWFVGGKLNVAYNCLDRHVEAGNGAPDRYPPRGGGGGAIHTVVFGGFSAESVRERIEFSEAKTLITVDGARRKGKTAPIKETGDEVIGDVVDTTDVVDPR